MVPLTCNGFTACGMAAGIKKNGNLDLGMLVSDRPARVAAVFTRNRVQAAPVKLDRERVKSGTARVVIVNAGNANCANGPQGLAAADAMAAAAARVLNLPDEQVLVASTGVIGAPFPIHKVEAAMPALAGGLSPNGLPDLARAIMTTDTRPKTAAREGSAGGVSYSIVAVAKGAGMIRPDMATMLCFICTDADIPVSESSTGAEAVGGRVFQPHHHRRGFQHQRHGDSHGQRRLRGKDRNGHRHGCLSAAVG